MTTKSKLLLIVILLALFLPTVPGTAWGYTAERLETLAGSDFIPEIREAASKALTKIYTERNVSLQELKITASTARTENLRNAATEALVKKYENVREISSLQEVKNKAKDLEKQAVAGSSVELRQASSRALGLFYLAFNLNDVPGYGKDDLEGIVRSEKEKPIRKAAADALGSIYPNHYYAEELRELINSEQPVLIKEAAAIALSIRYYTQLSPDLSIDKLKEIATDKKKNRWLRKAAGGAYGKLAVEKIGCQKLKTLTLEGSTAEIRKGASAAWTECLINSEKTETDLLRMACAATSVKPQSYKDALVAALGDRMLTSSAGIGGKDG